MAKRRSKKEIAEHLFISPGTVKKHFDNLYAKLEVDNSQEAVAKAAAFGLLSFDFADLIQPMRDRRELNFNPFAAVLLNSARMGREQGWVEPMNRLAAMGLMLFLLSPLTVLVRESLMDTSRLGKGRGVLFEFTPDGHLIRSFDGEGELRHPIALAFAPPAAERQGFTPGHLFVADVHDSHPVNLTRLLELTPDGRCLRAFTGGEYLSTSLRSRSITFSPDGKLLAGSAAFIDAVLAFTEGGRVVRRFATLVVAALTADQRGNVYVAGGSSREQGVYVFNVQGAQLRAVGAVSAGDYIYDGVTVGERGNLFVGNVRAHAIEVYNARGHRLGVIKGSGLHHPQRLALSPNGNLYVMESEGQAVKVFHPTRGAFLFSFPAPQGARLSDLIFGPNGNLFVTAFWT